MKKWSTRSSCMLWMVSEMLSSFPRPYFCSTSLSWDEPQIPCQMETRSCFFSLIQPYHFTSQLPRIYTHLSGYHLNTKHFLERKQRRNKVQRREGWDWALPYLVAVDTFVGALPRVNPHVFVQAGGLGKALPTYRALGGRKRNKVKRKRVTV